MYTQEELYKLIDGAVHGYLPSEGDVYNVTMTPKQRDCLLHLLGSYSVLNALGLRPPRIYGPRETICGLNVFIDDSVPAGTVEIRDNENQIVGQIVGLAGSKPQSCEGEKK